MSTVCIAGIKRSVPSFWKGITLWLLEVYVAHWIAYDLCRRPAAAVTFAGRLNQIGLILAWQASLYIMDGWHWQRTESAAAVCGHAVRLAKLPVDVPGTLLTGCSPRSA